MGKVLGRAYCHSLQTGPKSVSADGVGAGETTACQPHFHPPHQCGRGDGMEKCRVWWAGILLHGFSLIRALVTSVWLMLDLGFWDGDGECCWHSNQEKKTLEGGRWGGRLPKPGSVFYLINSQRHFDLLTVLHPHFPWFCEIPIVNVKWGFVYKIRSSTELHTQRMGVRQMLHSEMCGLLHWLHRVEDRVDSNHVCTLISS